MDVMHPNVSFNRVDSPYSLHSNSSSDTSVDGLNFDRLSLNTKHIKLERYFNQLIALGREIPGRDHT